jgi:fluoride exporter
MRLGIFLVGATLGAVSRYLIVTFFRASYRFPVGVLVVNVLGSFLLGVMAAEKNDLAFGLVGFCGALTTWSGFSLDLRNQIGARDYRNFLLNLFLNYGLGVAAAMIGIWVRG